MALKQCPVCERVYPEHRARCPNCGTANVQESVEKRKKGGLVSSRGRIVVVFLVLAILAGLNVWQATTRITGPDPQEEALHSPQEALRLCREALDLQLSEQDPEIVSELEVEYLQGGEYEVTATVDLRAETSRTRREALCELQFRPEAGWTVREIRLAEG